nr:hypothetical protein Itr_chr03CG11480 [Ipomoea trifida]
MIFSASPLFRKAANGVETPQQQWRETSAVNGFGGVDNGLLSGELASPGRFFETSTTCKSSSEECGKRGSHGLGPASFFSDRGRQW